MLVKSKGQYMGILILTRRIGEALIIDDNIKLTIMGIKGNQVRIGIDAPKNIAVDREEIHLRKKISNISFDEKHV